MQDGQIITDGSVKWQICDTRIPFPVGYVIHDRALRTGFIKVNKATILRNDFIRLYKWANDNGLIIDEALKNSDIKYSTFFGSGNGSTTFSLPDERGLTDKSWDDGKGYDVGRILGSFQGDAIRNIYGTIIRVQTANTSAHSIQSIATGVFKADVASYNNSSLTLPAQTYYTSIVFDANSAVPTAAENRVRNIAKIAQIKY